MHIDGETYTIIKPKKGWQIIDLKELREYRDLFWFFVWRDIKVLYAQTVLGFTWAFLNPLVQIVIFSIIFGGIAKITTDGIPYVLFTSVAVIPWSYMSGAMISSSQSLISGKGMLGRIYFPRLIFPISPVLSNLVDFCISISILIPILFYYRVVPTWKMTLFPFFVIMMTCVPLTVGLWFSSIAIRFRDVKFGMGFFSRMLMYSAPIVYPISAVPERYRMIYSLNPIVGVIEGMRASLLGTSLHGQYVLPGILTLAVLLVSGAFYFKRTERIIVDVI
jgi:homopolymeric O-antigen transport system permease protein